MNDHVEHKLDWITNGKQRAESTTPTCSCGWEGAPVAIGDKDAHRKMRVQWDAHLEPHMPSNQDTLH
jgi:hypothetical protein